MAIVEIRDFKKTYAGGFEALKGVTLDIEEGEILALLGPNGAGKTTLISALCGLVSPTGGQATIGGYDVVKDYRAARGLVGLVPQEIALDQFSKVIDAVRFTRGLFGLPRDEAHIEDILKKLSLWDKRNTRIVALSGGMKRRVLIAKALSHSPRVLFLDEPTAGVDVELRRDMWEIVSDLKKDGVTIILTTHYIEEAEAIADRIGVINGGKLLLVENKDDLMTRMGSKELQITLRAPAKSIPKSLSAYALTLSDDGQVITYSFDAQGEATGITALIADLSKAGLKLADLQTKQSSLEEIFVGLVGESAA